MENPGDLNIALGQGELIIRMLIDGWTPEDISESIDVSVDIVVRMSNILDGAEALGLGKEQIASFLAAMIRKVSHKNKGS